MISFLLKALLVSALVIISFMFGGVFISGFIDSTPQQAIIEQPKITPTSTIKPRLVVTPLPLVVPQNRIGTLEFNGYPCTEDCSGHEAGYEWAEENGIEDPEDCGGNSNSFIEGCESYAEEYQEEYGYDDDVEYDSYYSDYDY